MTSSSWTACEDSLEIKSDSEAAQLNVMVQLVLTDRIVSDILRRRVRTSSFWTEAAITMTMVMMVQQVENSASLNLNSTASSSHSLT